MEFWSKAMEFWSLQEFTSKSTKSHGILSAPKGTNPGYSLVDNQ